MFTGIVAELGEVAGIEHRGDAARLTIRGDTGGVIAGESIAVNGVCLTVTGVLDGTFTADVMGETLDRTSLGALTPGAPVNPTTYEPPAWATRAAVTPARSGESSSTSEISRAVARRSPSRARLSRSRPASADADTLRSRPAAPMRRPGHRRRTGRPPRRHHRADPAPGPGAALAGRRTSRSDAPRRSRRR